MDREQLALKISAWPLQFQETAGCYFLIRNGQALSEAQVIEALRVRNHDKQRTEAECNRMFVIADFWDEVGDTSHYTDDDLIFMAQGLASRIEQSLQHQFSGTRFHVAIIGLDLVDEEPLELCVTFSQQG